MYSHKGKEFLFTFFPSVTQPASNIQHLAPQGFCISFLSYKLTVINGHIYDLRPFLYPRGPFEGQDTKGLRRVQRKGAGNTNISNICACQVPIFFFFLQTLWLAFGYWSALENPRSIFFLWYSWVRFHRLKNVETCLLLSLSQNSRAEKSAEDDTLNI